MNATGELAARLAGSKLVLDQQKMDVYRRDQAHLAEPGHPLAVLLAESTNDVSVALAWAGKHGIPVVTRGAGSGLSGGAAAIDGCLVLSTARMTTIHEISVEDQLAVVDAGVINADVDRAAAAVGLMYAPDPSSHEISTIGGNIATNAGGLRCVKYGVTRDSVLGLEVVLADGAVIHTGHRTVKGVTGYDLTSLLVGSEGTLGVITQATLRLRPRPTATPAMVIGNFPSLRAAGDAVASVIRMGRSPSLLELIDRPTLQAIDDWKHIGLESDTEAILIAQADGVDAESSAQAMRADFENAGATFAAFSSDEQEAAQFIGIRRMVYPALERLGRCLVEDVVVPRSKLPDLLNRIGQIATDHRVTIMTVAHAGDGNVHPTFVFEPLPDGAVPDHVWAAAGDVFHAALELGGTLTGEHGVGTLKKRWLSLELGETALALQRSIKNVFDPVGILNPGKVL